MPQDAFTLKFIAKELNGLLTGGKVSKITQPAKEILTFIVYTAKGSVKLEICVAARGCRINLTDAELGAPKVAPAFCMLLRKYLQNAEITSVGRIDGERIVFINFDCTSEFELEKITLYAEIMGKYSNAVLVKDGIILGALKTSAIGENTKRVLFSGAKYVLPEAQNKYSPHNILQLTQIFDNTDGDRAKIIAEKIRGVSYSTAEEIMLEFGEKVTGKDVYNYLNDEENISPCVTFLKGAPEDFKVRSRRQDAKKYPNVLAAQTAYYDYITTKTSFENRAKKLKNSLSSMIKKLEKRLALEDEKLLDCADMDEIKLKGELIFANIYAVPQGAEWFEAVNYYSETGEKVKIKLDKTLSPADNAQRFYKKYNKLKRTAESVSAQKSETEGKLKYLSGINSDVDRAENSADLEEIEEELKSLDLLPRQTTEKTEKKKVAPPFRLYICGEFKILAGRNNVQNDRLLKSVSGGDMWLHTQKYHSSHVIIECEDQAVPDDVLLKAAEICAYYSDGRNGTKIPVDYTRRSNVKKPPKANAGFVTYTDYKTILVTPNAHEELKYEE